MAKHKRAFITGITGQDGSYLAEFLLDKGYDVFGLVRRSANPDFSNIEGIKDKVTLIEGDLTDQVSLEKAIKISKPDEVYNLAAQSFVRGSFDYPVSTAEITGIGVLKLLEAVKEYAPTARVYQASSSEMFGNRNTQLDETNQLNPRSPYGCAKVYAHNIANNYRESYDMHISCGILFNHESPRRSKQFVTRKVTSQVAEILAGKRKFVELGNMQAERDWGDARDYVRAMWLMLQQDKADNYVVATGEYHSVEQMVNYVFNLANLDVSTYVRIDKKNYRPAEIDRLWGNPYKANKKLGWEPEISFEQMLEDMLKNDMENTK